MTDTKIRDYDAWAQTYDQTRGVSPSVLGPLLEALGPPDDRSLLDIGGGTGNYSVALAGAGFRAVHCDPSVEMVRMAASKAEIPDAVVADGQALPFGNGTLDCAIAIKVLNHVQDRDAFMREARRVVHGGPVVLVHATKECIEGNWITHYVPSLLGQERFEPEEATVEQVVRAGFRVEVTHIRYTDMADGSAQALKRFPEALLTEERIMNTSLLSRLPDDLRREAFEAMRRDHASGRLRDVIAEYEALSEKHRDGTMFVGRP
jgi:ubiquinone/menaquinone biosynthesis C-methylase UbiE